MLKKILIISIIYLLIILILTLNISKLDNAYIYFISIISLIFFISILREIYKKYSIDYKSKNNKITYINSKGSNHEKLKKISTRPFLFGLENKFISEDSFYFDNENFYAINKENKKAIFKLTDITEINKTFIQINNRRLWQVKIKQQGTQKEITFKFAHNYSIWNNNFTLFYEKMKLINPSSIKSKWNFWGW